MWRGIYICECMQQLGIFIRRYSEDTASVNGYGKKLLDICKNNMVCMFNGRVGEDYLIGKHTTTFKTVVDYVIGSPFLISMVLNFKVLNFNPLFSDVHCGISFSIKNDSKCMGEEVLADGESTEHGLSRQRSFERDSSKRPGKWSKYKSHEYINNIDKDFVSRVIENADFKLVSELNDDLKKILIEPALKTFPHKRDKFTKKSNNSNLSGYDKQCYISRQEYHKAKHKNNVERSERSYNDMITKSKTYKQELKRVKGKEQRNLIAKLKETKAKNPKLYWQGTTKINEVPILITEFMNHFKKLSQEGYSENVPSTVIIDIDNNSVLNNEVTEDEICTCILKLRIIKLQVLTIL